MVEFDKTYIWILLSYKLPNLKTKLWFYADPIQIIWDEKSKVSVEKGGEISLHPQYFLKLSKSSQKADIKISHKWSSTTFHIKLFRLVSKFP